jgi:hypothetical protein
LHLQRSHITIGAHGQVLRRGLLLHDSIDLSLQRLKTPPQLLDLSHAFNPARSQRVPVSPSINPMVKRPE